jgi:AraC family transcriptional regulator, arabinose operon regulatory protein
MDVRLINIDYMMKKIKDGFPEQRLIVVSHELVKRQRKLAIAHHLYITDIGHFPLTKNHFVSRKNGIDQTILIFCAAGKGTVTVRGKKRELIEGQLILIPPGVPHKYEADPSIPWNIYWFHFAGDQADEYLNLLCPDPAQPVMQLTSTDEFVRQFETLYAFTIAAFSDSALVRSSAELARTLCLVNALRTGLYKKSRQSEQRILKSIEYIVGHYEQPHTLEKLARNAGLSTPHYAALFRKQTGTSPFRYLTRVRMRHACERLHRSNLSIQEIAAELGYPDPYYFSRIFKNVQGCSPANYRRAVKK